MNRVGSPLSFHTQALTWLLVLLFLIYGLCDANGMEDNWESDQESNMPSPYQFRDGTKVIKANMKSLDSIMNKIRFPKVKDEEAMIKELGSMKFKKMMRVRIETCSSFNIYRRCAPLTSV